MRTNARRICTVCMMLFAMLLGTASASFAGKLDSRFLQTVLTDDGWKFEFELKNNMPDKIVTQLKYTGHYVVNGQRKEFRKQQEYWVLKNPIYPGKTSKCSISFKGNPGRFHDVKLDSLSWMQKDYRPEQAYAPAPRHQTAPRPQAAPRPQMSSARQPAATCRVFRPVEVKNESDTYSVTVEFANNSETHNLVRLDDIVLDVHGRKTNMGSKQVMISPMGLQKVTFKIRNPYRPDNVKVTFQARYLPARNMYR